LYCNATGWECRACELAFGEAVFVDSPHGFQVELKPDRERVTVRVLGEVDLATAGDVECPIRELLDSGFETVVVDLREVSFLDSSGIGVLISSHRYAQERGARLSIVVGRSRSREVMELSGVIDHLDVS
jgi:anti-sigma B factor antagonist